MVQSKLDNFGTKRQEKNYSFVVHTMSHTLESAIMSEKDRPAKGYRYCIKKLFKIVYGRMKIFQTIHVNISFSLKSIAIKDRQRMTNIHPSYVEFKFSNPSCEHGYNQLTTLIRREGVVFARMTILLR